MTQHIPCSSASRMASSAWCALRLGRNPKESLSNSAYARKLGSLLARRYSARCNSRSFSGVLSVATIPSSFLAEVASSSRAPSLQRLSPPSSVLRTRPTPRPARPPQLAALCVRTRSLTAPVEASRVQRIPFAACRPCYPGRARPASSRLPGAFCLRPFTRGSASPFGLTGLHLGLLRATARRFAAAGLLPGGILAPLLLVASRRHAGDLATRMLDSFEAGSFHPAENAPLCAAHRELVHPRVAVDLARGELIVEPAEASRVLDRGRAAPPPRYHVIELDLMSGAADSSSVHHPLAAPAVPLPHRPLHVGGDVVRLRTRRLAQWLLDEPLPFGVALEEEVQPGRQDLALGGTGMRVGERGASGRELLHEPARHRHVQSPEVGGERLGDGARRRRRDGRSWLLDRVGTRSFVRMKWDFQDGVPGCGRGEDGRGRRGAHRRDDRAVRPGLGRAERSGDRLRAGLGQMEEPRQDVVTVLGREDLRELDDARHAKPPVAQRVDDLLESLDEPRGGLPVERGPAREPELDPQPLPVEVGEGDEELGERGALALEELGETGGEIACGGHDASIAREFWASPDARMRVRERERQRVLENSLARLRRTRGEICRTRSGIPARSLTAEIIWR